MQAVANARSCVRYHWRVKRLIIADSHIGQGENDAAVMSSLVRRAAAQGVNEIVYLGDGFQYLIGMSKFWTSGLREVLDSWREVRRGGVRIVVIEGNRDFFLGEREFATEIDWSGRRYVFSSGERRFLLDHGDLVNRRDIQYRFWSKVSKSAIARIWARLLPKSLAVAIVRYMEAHLATTNRKYRYTIPVDDLRRHAEKAWEDGIDILFWGHFHALWEHREADRLAMILPAWLDSRTGVLVNPDGNWHCVDRHLKNCDFISGDG
jgi:UDP-2,3-diacylglucosamine pyrophosphatase LpxH